MTEALPIYTQDDNAVLTPCFVSVCADNRAFGGHEEGGWWYHTAERLECHYAANLLTLSRIMARIQAEYSNVGRYPIHSVCCDGIFRVVIASEPEPQYEPTRRPHYE